MTFACLATVCLLAGLATVAEADEEFRPMKYRNCKSKFEILGVEAIGCGKADRCVFHHNSEPRIRIVFRPDRPVADLRTSVWANLGDAHGALAKFHLENERACEASNLTCPLTAGQVHYYTQTVRILPEYPTVDVQINWLVSEPRDAADGGEAANSPPPAGRDICVKFLGTVRKEQ